MGHQISIDPPDHTRVNISDLEEVVHGGITSSTAAVNNLTHPPILVSLFSGEEVMPDNDRHARFHVKKDWML